jgi:hypothetical protein
MSDLWGLIKSADSSIESALDPYQLAYYRAKTINDPEALRQLANIVLATLPTGMHSFRGIEKLVRIHFGHSISFISVRTDLRCTNKRVREYQQAVKVSMAAVRESLVLALEVKVGSSPKEKSQLILT